MSSFENVFCQWLTSKYKEVSEEESEGREEKQLQIHDTDPATEFSVEEHGIQEIPLEAQKNDTQDKSILQKMADISPHQRERTVSCPQSSPLKITLPFRDAQVAEERQNMESHDKFASADNARTITLEGGKKENVNVVGTFLSDEQVRQGFGTEERDHQQCPAHCHTQSVVTSFSDTNQSMSPNAPKGLRLDPALSPDRDVHMEPDSTSESEHVSPEKCIQSGKATEISMHKVSPRVQVSPHSTVDAINENLCNRVILHVDENQAECDSTSMLLTPCSAISPSSQGEIEERVCPFLTDHEDGASPNHCVCSCHLLPPPTNLLPRDHVPINTAITCLSPSNFAKRSPCSNNSFVSKSLSSLVSCKLVHVNKKTTNKWIPTPSITEEVELSKNKLQNHNEISDLFKLPSPGRCNKNSVVEDTEFESKTVHTVSELKEKDDSMHLKLKPDLTDSRQVEVTVSDTKQCKQLTTTALNEQELSSMHSEHQGHIYKAKDIDWGAAVAETLESCANATECDGESKPGIILRIRTKAATPCAESESNYNIHKNSSVCKKRCSVDSPDILSRLRKRHKSGDMEKTGVPTRSEQITSKRTLATSETRCKLQEDDKETCLSKIHSCPKNNRRNTIQLGGNLRLYKKSLSSDHSEFVETASQLFRLQTVTHELVCVLFPSLRPRVDCLAPDSRHFSKIVEDIIRALEGSDSEETDIVVETVCEKFGRMTLKQKPQEPVLSPQVFLCRSPQHSLQHFKNRICTLLQLLLPDLVASFSANLSSTLTSSQLEEVLRKVVLANEKKKLKKGS